MNINDRLTRSKLTKLIYNKQRKKSLDKVQIRRCLDLLIKVSRDLSDEANGNTKGSSLPNIRK